MDILQKVTRENDLYKRMQANPSTAYHADYAFLVLMSHLNEHGLNFIEKKIISVEQAAKQSITFYTFEHDHIVYDLEKETAVLAANYATEWWQSKCEDLPMKNGDTREDSCFIVKFSVDDEGNKHEVSRFEHALYFEKYHGDLAEHGTY